MTTDLKTPDITPSTVERGRLTSLRVAIRTRRASRRAVAREIAAYPATRSAATVVMPPDRPFAG